MPHGIQTFEIQLNKSSLIYAPGETIRGRIMIRLYKPKCIRALKVLVRGTCRVNDNDANTRGPSESVRAEETYLNTDILLCGGNEEDVALPAGENQFLFNYELPDNAPSTFSHKFGLVRYTMKAVMERPWKFNHEADTFFRIEAPLKLDTLNMTPIDDTDAKNVSMFLPCFTNGYIRFRFRLPQNGFNCHEKIPLKINYINKSRTVDVKKMTCTLIQYLTFHNRAPFHNKRTQKNEIERVTQTGAFPKEYEGVMELKVPDVPVSYLRNCKFIDVDYQLYVTVSMNGCNFKVKKVYDVIIGSSTRETFDSEIFFAQNRNIVNASANSPIQTITYISPKPDIVDTTYVTESPPSYDSIVSHHHGVNHDHHVNDDHDHHVISSHHHVHDSHDHNVISSRHHVHDSHDHHVSNDQHHVNDSHHHDGGYDGGCDGGYDGGYDGGCDGGYDGGNDGGCDYGD